MIGLLLSAVLATAEGTCHLFPEDNLNNCTYTMEDWPKTYPAGDGCNTITEQEDGSMTSTLMACIKVPSPSNYEKFPTDNNTFPINNYSASDPDDCEIAIYDKDNPKKILVCIRNDNAVLINPSITLDDGARAFWEAVGKTRKEYK